MTRRIVLISGAPGVGKTTIARPLATELGLPLFAKDTIKESLHDVLGEPGPVDLAWSRKLGAASFEVLWRLAADSPACVLEANLSYGNQRQDTALRELSEDGILVELHLTCPHDEILRRFHTRAASGERHRVHLDMVFSPEEWATWSKPIGLGHVIQIDTTEPVDIKRTANLVRGLLT